MSQGCCLLCENFLPVAPADWKPSYGGETYTVHNVRDEMRQAGGRQRRGHCTLNPVHVEVFTSHVCSHFEPVDVAIRTLSEFVWGSWRERKYGEAKEEAEIARRQLKAARKMSQGRLQRIRRLTEKNKKSANVVKFPKVKSAS